MKTFLFSILFCLLSSTLPAVAQTTANAASAPTSTGASETSSQQMSKDLQNLPWKPFKAIIEAVPKLATDVNAYGPLGWQFVKENYKTYDWKKKIDKLDATQKKQLADLIRKARTTP